MSTAIQTPLPAAGLNDPGLVDRVRTETHAEHFSANPEFHRGDRVLARLAAAVQDLHDDQHDGPLRHCTAACRYADEALRQLA